MEIKIKDRVFGMSIEVKKLLAETRKDFNMERTMDEVLEFNYFKEEDNEEKRTMVKFVVANELKWSYILPNLVKYKIDKLQINMHLCEVDGLPVFSPDCRTETDITLKEERINKTDLILIHSLICSPEHHIENYIANRIFPYGDKDFTLIAK